jgi:DNA-binding protein HU-beta
VRQLRGVDPVRAWLAEVVAKVEVDASSCGLLLFSGLLRFKPAASHRRNDEAMIDNSLLVEPDRRWGNDFGFRFRRAYKGFEMAKMTKNQLIDAIAEGTEVSKADVKAVIEQMTTVGYKELNESGEFVVPGFVKMSVVNKPATEARSGVNPFTKEPMEFAAKPASKSVKASPLKVAKDAV